MVSFNSIALLSLAAIGSLAAPAKRNPGPQQCLTRESASIMATKWGELIATYTNETAEALLAPNFSDYSESVNSLINSCPQGDAAKAMSVPLLAASFDSREKFMEGQSQQPPINFELLKFWYSCDTVSIRWETNNTANITDVKPVIGLIILETVPAPQSEWGHQITTVYSEFDAAAWLQNLHAAGFCTTEGVVTGSLSSGSGSGSGSAPGSGAPGSGAPGSGAPGSGAPGAPSSTTSAGSWTAPSSAPAWSASSSAPAWSATSSAAGWSASSTPCSSSTSSSSWAAPTGSWSNSGSNSTVHVARPRLMI